MWNFNVVVTMASAGIFRRLLDELEECGEFRRTEFLGVVLGKVASTEDFLETIREQRLRRLIAFQDIGRVVPLEQVFTFTVDNFHDHLRAVIFPYLDTLVNSRFHVRLERRGHKGQIVSPEVERELDAFIIQELTSRGHSAGIDFERPDAIVAVETIGDRCGVGLLTRKLMDRYEFVRVD